MTSCSLPSRRLSALAALPPPPQHPSPWFSANHNPPCITRLHLYTHTSSFPEIAAEIWVSVAREYYFRNRPRGLILVSRDVMLLTTEETPGFLERGHILRRLVS